MNRVIVDTDVVSFAAKQDSRFSFYRDHLRGKTLILSFMTVAELEYWALVRNWGSARERKLRDYIADRFLIYPYNDQLCSLWAKLTYEAKQKGCILHSADAWIAATALHAEAPLVTHNTKHFEYLTGLIIISR